MTFVDPVMAVKQLEDAGRRPFIAPQEFRTDYEPQPDGSVKEVDWVVWIKKGMQNPSTIECKVSRMPKFYALEWEVLEPAYKRWKEKQTATVEGTPLAAWPGMTPSLVKVLQSVNIYSVEDFVQLEDSAISRLAVPGLRGKIATAKAFLAAMVNTAGVSNEVTKLREENEFLKKEMAELKAMVVGDKPEPKRRGRPPKIQVIQS